MMTVRYGTGRRAGCWRICREDIRVGCSRSLAIACGWSRADWIAGSIFGISRTAWIPRLWCLDLIYTIIWVIPHICEISSVLGCDTMHMILHGQTNDSRSVSSAFSSSLTLIGADGLARALCRLWRNQSRVLQKLLIDLPLTGSLTREGSEQIRMFR